MEKAQNIDIAKLSAAETCDKLESALEVNQEVYADRQLWTEQFAASGKSGKGG
jgi:hypothetical protein